MASKKNLANKPVVVILGITGSLASVIALAWAFHDRPHPESLPIALNANTSSAAQSTTPASAVSGTFGAVVNSQVIQQSGGTITVHSTPTGPSPAVVAGQAAVPKIYGLSYDEARKLLIREGWIPTKRYHTEATSLDVQSGNGPTFWDRGYWEIVSCSGTGAGYCAFHFSDPSGRYLAVTTEGEEDEDGAYHAKVDSYSLVSKDWWSSRVRR